MDRLSVIKELVTVAKLIESDKKLWDSYTERHFQRWLDNTISDDEREEVEEGIRKLVEDDPELMEGAGHSWSELERMIKR